MGLFRKILGRSKHSGAKAGKLSDIYGSRTLTDYERLQLGLFKIKPYKPVHNVKGKWYLVTYLLPEEELPPNVDL